MVNMEDWEPLLIDYAMNQLSVAQREEVERALVEYPELKVQLTAYQDLAREMEQVPELAPSRQLDDRFYRFLAETQAQEKKSPLLAVRTRYRMFLRVAAAIALVALGAVLATVVLQQSEGKQLAFNQQKEDHQMLSLLEEPSVSDRIKAVNISYKMKAPNDPIITALIKVMNTDKSTNVRLAAIEALHHFADDKRVRSALVDSLLRQTDPSLQIVLINILVEIKDQRSLPKLENIINDTEVNETVREEAQIGIFKLT